MVVVVGCGREEPRFSRSPALLARLSVYGNLTQLFYRSLALPIVVTRGIIPPSFHCVATAGKGNVPRVRLASRSKSVKIQTRIPPANRRHQRREGSLQRLCLHVQEELCCVTPSQRSSCMATPPKQSCRPHVIYSENPHVGFSNFHQPLYFLAQPPTRIPCPSVLDSRIASVHLFPPSGTAPSHSELPRGAFNKLNVHLSEHSRLLHLGPVFLNIQLRVVQGGSVRCWFVRIVCSRFLLLFLWSFTFLISFRYLHVEVLLLPTQFQFVENILRK